MVGESNENNELELVDVELLGEAETELVIVTVGPVAAVAVVVAKRVDVISMALSAEGAGAG